MTCKILRCLSLTGTKRSFRGATIAILKSYEERALASLCQRRDDQTLLASEILVTELLVVLKNFKSNFTRLSVELVHNLVIKRIDVRVVLHIDVGNDSLDIVQIELHVELPAKVSYFEDALSLEFGSVVAMINKNCDESDHS